MTLTRDDFGAFFAELHGGHQPFDWQWRLLDAVVDGAAWPEAITAPTGAGKTAVIDVHVFASALAFATGRPQPPRRLSMVVPRRVLVDDQHAHAVELAHRLATANSGLLLEVADALWGIQGGRPEAGPGEAMAAPVLVARLRGGAPPSVRWVDHPSAVAILCCTPDMWGSRLLFRGYGSSPRSWPREAGLLTFDSVVVVDEAHLAKQLLHTARRVAELATAADDPALGPKPLQIVETTATPESGSQRTLGVSEDDVATDKVLRNRLCQPKPITLLPTPGWPAKISKSVINRFSDAVVESMEQPGSGTVGCFVNSVAMAVGVTAELQQRQVGNRSITVVLVCGQIRPADLDALKVRYPGLFTTVGNTEVDVLVSTQSLEVGVDIDFRALVTELATGSALAQRAGRVNRRGLRESCPISILVPGAPLGERDRSGPYGSDELELAHEWVQRLASNPNGLSPWAVRESPPPVASMRRTLLQRPEIGDAWQWARTSDDSVVEPELDLWLSDDLEPDTGVGIVVRREVSGDPILAIETLTVVPPRTHEVFSVPINVARESLAVAWSDHLTEHPESLAQLIRVRGDEVSILEWRDGRDGTLAPIIRPGDVVVVGDELELFTSPVSDIDVSPAVPAPAGHVGKRFPAADVLEIAIPVEPGSVVRRFAPEDFLAVPVDDAYPEISQTDLAELLMSWIRSQSPPSPLDAAVLELLEPSMRAEVTLIGQTDGRPTCAIVTDRRRAVADEYIRQEWTPSAGPVLLQAHQDDVRERARELAQRHLLADPIADALERAALHHDDGKRDSRFQVRLGSQQASEPWAKSIRTRSWAQMRRQPDLSGLPARWRHEQLSVVLAWPQLESHPLRELTARLIGTTHGYGRAGFPHSASLLVGAAEEREKACAGELFDVGLWDELIESTDRKFGVWFCAYLEALLRAADGQISAEGR